MCWRFDGYVHNEYWVFAVYEVKNYPWYLFYIIIDYSAHSNVNQIII